MKKIFLFFIIFITSTQALRMKRVCFLQSGQYTGSNGKTICCDSDHDGLNELIFRTGTINPPDLLRWEIWEYRPYNCYELVFTDTGAYPYPSGITTGNFRPHDVGDIDQDSLTDLLGFNVEETPDSLFNVITTQESPNYSLYPESLSWWYRFHPGNTASFGPCYFAPDLDNDGKQEIVCVNPYDGYTYIFENISNNQNQIVWSSNQVGGWSFIFGDFDLDNRKEFVTANLASLGRVSVYENIADNQYEMIYQDTVYIPNGTDIFYSNDLDSDGKPEFFVSFARIVDANSWNFYLYMWEATGNNTYERTFVWGQRVGVIGPEQRSSKCADIDGDSIEELIWATPINITAYEAIGNNQFQPIWQWWQDHGTLECLVVNSYDMNKNGYNEIVVGGSGKTSIFEIEAVRLIRPNGSETFVGNTQELIRWQKFYPPRCDSLSLFYSVDKGRTYNTVITGISSADTSYLWTVPDTSSDSCKVKIIAYGPGWQFDESDGVFTITPSGIDEIASPSLAMTSIEISPNPVKGKIRFKIWNANQDLTLKIYNLAGELVKDFSERFFASLRMTKGGGEFIWDGTDDKGKRLPTGVYFYRLKTSDSISETKEFIILR